MSVAYSKSTKSYVPSKVVTDVLSDIDRYEDRRLRLEDRIRAGGIKKQQIIEEKKALKVERRKLDRRKVDLLNNHIFPSMANLTIFLELMLVSPNLHSVFERDLRALFLAKSEVSMVNKSASGNETIFARFIEACCWNTTKPKEGGPRTPLSDFRFILMEIMMDKIRMMIPAIGEHKFKSVEFLNRVLYTDFERVAAWMTEFAHEPHGRLDFDAKRRPALF